MDGRIYEPKPGSSVNCHQNSQDVNPYVNLVDVLRYIRGLWAEGVDLLSGESRPPDFRLYFNFSLTICDGDIDSFQLPHKLNNRRLPRQ